MLSHLRLAGAGFALAALIGGAVALAVADGHDQHPGVHQIADDDGAGGQHAGSPGILSGS